MPVPSYLLSDFMSGLDFICAKTKLHQNIVIHSSLFKFGFLADASYEKLFAQIIEYFGPDRRLFFPSYSYSFRRAQSFNPLELHPSTVREMGILTKLAFDSNNRRRTLCPLFSYIAIGSSASSYVVRPSDFCFGPLSLFGRLFDEGATFLGLGINYSNGMTCFMHIEKVFGVPFRFDLPLDGHVFDQTTCTYVPARAIHYARDEINYPSLITNFRESIGLLMEEKGISNSTQLNTAKMYALESSGFMNFVLSQLSRDPFCMTSK